MKGCRFIGVASRDIYTDTTEGGTSLPQLPHESQLLASVAILSSLMQSRFNFEKCLFCFIGLGVLWLNPVVLLVRWALQGFDSFQHTLPPS
jgi:hypothetical protein